jgi:glycosyltransferase involved in cell wall biosynthesis
VHIAFFNRSFHPDVSATGQLLTELCEDLVREHGCRVSVVCGPPLRWHAISEGAGQELSSRQTYRGVEIHRVWGTRFDKRRFAGRAANYVSYFLGACRAGLRLDRPDVVVALTDPPIVGLAGWLAAKRAGAPLVMWFQDLFPEVAALLEDFHSDTVNRALLGVNRFLCRRAVRVVAIGETMARRLVEDKGAPPERMQIIANWADTATISPRPRRNPFAERHELFDAFVVMHSGNIGLSQGLDALVDAAALLRDLPDVRVVFLGDGIMRPALEERARASGLTNVRFLPYVPGDQLGDPYATADVFVISLRQGMAGYIVPSKLYGILASGRPYAAAVEEDCEVAAITRRFGCGVLATPGDAASLADAIRTLRRDRELRRTLGENARAASHAFDRRVQVANHMALFRTVAQERHSPHRTLTIPAASELNEP